MLSCAHVGRWEHDTVRLYATIFDAGIDARGLELTRSEIGLTSRSPRFVRNAPARRPSFQFGMSAKFKPRPYGPPAGVC